MSAKGLASLRPTMPFAALRIVQLEMAVGLGSPNPPAARVKIGPQLNPTGSSIVVPPIIGGIESVFVPLSPSHIQGRPGSDDKNLTASFKRIHKIHCFVIYIVSRGYSPAQALVPPVSHMDPRHEMGAFLPVAFWAGENEDVLDMAVVQGLADWNRVSQAAVHQHPPLETHRFCQKRKAAPCPEGFYEA